MTVLSMIFVIMNPVTVVTTKVWRRLTALAAAAFVGGCNTPPALETTVVTGTAATEPVPTPDPFLTAKAKETGGDFGKLSAADQKKLNDMTHRHGVWALQSAAPCPCVIS